MLYNRQIYVTSSTLDGVCKELTVEDGDENQARQLSACAAWVQDQEEDADELEEFVMSEVSTIQARKKRICTFVGHIAQAFVRSNVCRFEPHVPLPFFII